MNLAASSEESYRDLIDRAEAYFRRVFPIRIDDLFHVERTAEVQKWLDDLEYTRTRELVETMMVTAAEDEEEIDVPL